MKYRIIGTLLTLTLLFTWLGIQATPAYAVGCTGTGCEGLNPSTMGCTAVRAGNLKYLSDGGANQSTVETRKSTDCDAKWTRVTNASGVSRYAAGSLRYGCANYCYSQSVSSPGTIYNTNVVYTPMHGLAGTPTRSCGQVGASGPIYTPISVSDTWCTGAN